MKHKKNDLQWDRKLNIHTTGRDDSGADDYHHPYEPTPYAVLERLAESGYIDGDNVVVDYGCGKGRVGFFLHHVLGCRTIGLEYDERIFSQAIQCQDAYFKGCGGKVASESREAVEDEVVFLCRNAAEYEVVGADCFYFFNPFSVEILRAVMARILDSYYENPRTMRLFFYYPDDEYVAYLMAGAGVAEELLFVDEIDCRDLFKGKDSRERILIFEIEG